MVSARSGHSRVFDCNDFAWWEQRRCGGLLGCAVLCSLTILIATGKEGTLCALLAFPIILAGLGIGLAIGIGFGAAVRWLLLERRENRTITMGVLVVTMPLVILAGDQVERPLLTHPRTEVIQTSVMVGAPPDEVWSKILSIDNVQASKPLLMHVGLPIPERCVLQRPGVGAKRTCYFNNGYIEETITGWNPPYYIGLTIDRTHMPGRHWLRFENAEYHLQANGTSTILTRTTTISSHLLPDGIGGHLSGSGWSRNIGTSCKMWY